MAEQSTTPESGSSPQAGQGNKSVRKSGVVVPNQPTAGQRIFAWGVFFIIHSLTLTLRVKWSDRSGLPDGQPAGRMIYATWHNRLALCLVAYFRFSKKRSKSEGLAAMISASKDGGLLSGVFERFGIQPVRGSSSRRGAQALREMTTWARKGHDLGITPDGPRGPKYVVQDGAIALAQLTGLPIIPYSYHLQWKLCMNSWDRFQLPLPFSRCEIIFGEPIFVPREATAEEREGLRLKLQEALMAISKD